jgi:hypothetical protein
MQGGTGGPGYGWGGSVPAYAFAPPPGAPSSASAAAPPPPYPPPPPQQPPYGAPPAAPPPPMADAHGAAAGLHAPGFNTLTLLNTVLDGRFKLTRFLSNVSGAYGFPYQGTELATGQPVFIKVLKSARDGNAYSVTRELEAVRAARGARRAARAVDSGGLLGAKPFRGRWHACARARVRCWAGGAWAARGAGPARGAEQARGASAGRGARAGARAAWLCVVPPTRAPRARCLCACRMCHARRTCAAAPASPAGAPAPSASTPPDARLLLRRAAHAVRAPSPRRFHARLVATRARAHTANQPALTRPATAPRPRRPPQVERMLGMQLTHEHLARLRCVMYSATARRADAPSEVVMYNVPAVVSDFYRRVRATRGVRRAGRGGWAGLGWAAAAQRRLGSVTSASPRDKTLPSLARDLCWQKRAHATATHARN